MYSVYFQSISSLNGMHQQSRTGLEKGRLKRDMVFFAVNIYLFYGMEGPESLMSYKFRRKG